MLEEKAIETHLESDFGGATFTVHDTMQVQILVAASISNFVSTLETRPYYAELDPVHKIANWFREYFVVKDSNRYDMTVALSNQYLLDLFLLM